MGSDGCILDRAEIHSSAHELRNSVCFLHLVPNILDETFVVDGSTLVSATKVNNEEGKSTFSTRLRTAMLPAPLRLLLLIIIVWGVIVGGNYWFIRIQLNGSKSVQKNFQFCFAAFKLS